MADVPRDPRQLARDILAGKISIEELAREQQRRRAGGGGGGGAAPPPKAPQQPQQRVPLPRQAPPPPPPPQRPVVRQPPQQPPAPRQAPRAKPAPQQRRAEPPQPRQPTRTPEPPPHVEVARAKGVTESQTASNRAKPVAAEKQLGIKRLMGSRTALRQGILLSEILGKPLALRDE